MPQVPRLREARLALQDHVATLTLDRPERRNALSPTMLSGLLEGLTWCREEPQVRVVVLTGTGDRAFCAGADLATFAGEGAALERHRERGAFVDLFLRLRSLGKPVVARVNGHALAGGFGLACSCDLMVAADHAMFGTPEVNVGVWPMMIQAILRRELPRKVLMEMVMLGERWTAAQMRDWGLANRVVPGTDLDSATATLAGALAAKSPAVMRLGKDSFYRQEDLAFEAALDYLHGQLALVAETEDSREGARAFLEKRTPRWSGR
ncbi:MAG: enoyl-CoA hydratase/isomerase family protein [Candidatus Dormibacterales bacterium]